MFKKKEPPSPLLKLSKLELANLVMGLQNQNAALSAELTIQHERANEAARIVGDLYNFFFNLLHGYVGVLQVYREEHNGKQVPALWLAARMCEHFEVAFNTRPLEHYGLGPDRIILKNLFTIARRPIAEGRLKSYLLAGIPEDTLNGVAEDGAAEQNQSTEDKSQAQ